MYHEFIQPGINRTLTNKRYANNDKGNNGRKHQMKNKT